MRLDPAAPAFTLPATSAAAPAPSAVPAVPSPPSQADGAAQATSGPDVDEPEVSTAMAESSAEQTEQTKAIAEPEVAALTVELESTDAIPIAGDDLMEEGDDGGDTEDESKMTDVVNTPGGRCDRVNAHSGFRAPLVVLHIL